MVAAGAKPGFYRVRNGDVIEVVAPSRVSRRWPPCAAGRIPYRRKASPQGGLAVFGFLPLDYPLKPAKRPRWWRKSTCLYYPQAVRA